MKRLIDKLGINIDLENFLRQNREIIIKVAAVALAIVAAFFVFASGGEEGNDTVNSDSFDVETEANETSEAVIYVDIGGEVNNPMLAELPEGSRVDDAIKAAGGLTDKADLTDINRAAFVEDGEKIYIPAVIEDDELPLSSVESGGGRTINSDGKININTADSDELQTLTGVGPVTAQKIIDYRQDNGRFSTIEDIKNVSGIGDKTFEKFKDDIKV